MAKLNTKPDLRGKSRDELPYILPILACRVENCRKLDKHDTELPAKSPSGRHKLIKKRIACRPKRELVRDRSRHLQTKKKIVRRCADPRFDRRICRCPVGRRVDLDRVKD